MCFFLSFCFFLLLFGCTTWLAGSYFPDQGSNPGPGSESARVLTTGLPGNSLEVCFKSDLDNDGSVSVWRNIVFPQRCLQALSGYANIRSEIE